MNTNRFISRSSFQLMLIIYILVILGFIGHVAVDAFAQDSLVCIDFSGSTTAANSVTVMGAGYGQYPEAKIAFGPIPTDNGFEGATDGNGMIVQADPGKGVMVFTQPIQTGNCALIRCSVRLSAPHASLYLASVDQGESEYVSTITPNNPSAFVGRYKRIADFFLPPSTGFQGIIQILNTSETESLTAYVDNLEVLNLGEDKIDLAISEITGTEPVPVSMTTPTPTPIPDENGETITLPLDLPEDVKPLEMVLIPAGTFMMGSPDDEFDRDPDEGPQHQVTITKPFYMGKYEVTQAHWNAVMGIPSRSEGGNLPKVYVKWDDCMAFIDALNQMGQGTFRLPSEAEWEYACRAGTQTRFFWGDDNDYTQIENYAWYPDNSGGKTHDVGGKLPNPWNLFDICGNVWELCQEWYGPYSADPQIDPIDQQIGTDRACRGGSWTSCGPRSIRTAFRYHMHPNNSTFDIGFRIIKE